MQDEEQVPDPQLMESMRAVGYSLDAALADLIDNSIAAEATEVEVRFSSEDEPFVAVLDNGTGMTPAEARVALKLAGTNRSQVRRSSDLGRFGLGLKTASLSQARVMTVLTVRDGIATGLRWDLNHLVATGRWSMQVLDPADVSALKLSAELLSQKSGTLVVWQVLDQLLGDTTKPGPYLAAAMAQAAEHLELVFHRFVGGEGDFGPVQISLNGRALEKIDPFLSTHKATQRSPIEVIEVGGTQVSLQAFTLPHLSKLNPAERHRGRLESGLKESQGFYVYRNKRLIDWGTWFRLAPREELAKMARVRVDIPNSLDALWNLDIKKSVATPPESVRRELRRLVERIGSQSKELHRFRGRVEDSGSMHVWELVKHRQSFSYRINRLHPLVQFASEDREIQAKFDRLVGLIESTFPVHDLYARMAGDAVPTEAAPDELLTIEMAKEMWRLLGAHAEGFDEFVTLLSGIEPFSRVPEVGKFLMLHKEEVSS